MKNYWRLVAAALRRLQEFAGTVLARRLVLGLFLVQAVVLVCVMRIGTPPDETNHIQFVQFYEHHSLSPIFDHQTPTYNLGDKTREPDYLYHYLLSLLLRITPFSTTGDVRLMRLVTLGMALLSFIVLARLLKRLGISDAATTTALLVLTNLPMVLMMSAAVNNDVSVWLGASLGLLLLLRLWQKPTYSDLALLVIVVLAGSLMKRTLLPLGLVFGILALLVVWRNYHPMLKEFWRFNARNVLLALLVLVCLGLFMERVGGNLVRYHTITPACSQVQGAAACKVFWSDASQTQWWQLVPAQKPTPLAYFPFRWAGMSFSNVTDIQTQYWIHKVQPARFVTPALVVVLAVATVYGCWYEFRRYKADTQARWRGAVLLITLYFMVVQMVVNYGSYRKTHFFGAALNGRYIIPTLLPLVGLACFYWGKMLRKHKTALTVLAVAVVITIAGFSGLELMLRNPQLHTIVSS